ncbi:hypothetical protein [Coleofasciculus sp. LEGE 07081]|nr:hypothetical protein [Coleofasciculus sp. LEGE 07081]
MGFVQTELGRISPNASVKFFTPNMPGLISNSAVEEWIVPGGGTTLVHLVPQRESWAADNLHGEELIGAMIVTYT